VPVVNALSDKAHPCQALADLQTMHENRVKSVAYIGDGNNVAHSLMLLGAKAGVHVAVATPPELRPDTAISAALVA